MTSISSVRLAGLALAVAAGAGARVRAQTVDAATVALTVPRRTIAVNVLPRALPAKLRSPQLQKIAELEQTRASRRTAGDRIGEAEVLTAIGVSQQKLGDVQKALAAYEEALRLARGGQASVAPGGASPPAVGGKPAGAPSGLRTPALQLHRFAAPTSPAASSAARTATSPRPSAETAPRPTAPLAALRTARERRVEATLLTSMGDLQAARGERTKAIERLEEALSIHTDLADGKGKATVMGMTAAIREGMGQNRRALDLYGREVPLRRELRDHAGAAAALNDKARIYRATGQKELAAVTLRESIDEARKARDEVRRMGKGAAFRRLSMDADAAEGRALAMQGALHAATSRTKKERKSARRELERALDLSRRAYDRGGEANALHEMGALERSAGNRSAAIGSFRKALLARRAAGQAAGEAETLASLSATLGSRSPAFATFLAKKAIRKYAAARVEHGFDRDLRRSFPAIVSAHRVSAALLLQQGRFDEARQLAASLKQLESDRAVRGEADGPPPSETDLAVPLTEAENEAEARYEEAAKPVTELGVEWEAKFESAPNPDDAEATKKWLEELDEIDKDLKKARKHLENVLASLVGDLPAGTAQDMRENVAGIQKRLHALGKGVVAIYTFVCEEKVWALVLTSKVEVPHLLQTTPAELSRMVGALREAIADRAADPKPAAKALYDKLVAPLEDDLDGAGATTIMWSLDGPLRYAPLAALHDGRRWLVERYQNVLFTPASETSTGRSESWTVLGLGVTKAHESLVALPGVQAELEAVVRENDHEGGVLPGRRLLDEEFTRASLMAGLAQGHRVVHVASHYVFRPVHSRTDTLDPDPSYLLLGDGKVLTLPDLGGMENVFQNVDLLALSACDTAMGGDDSPEAIAGAEIDGLARVAQQRGAGAVLATLWSVADASTPALMSEFYRCHQLGATKAAALQEAQVAMAHGRLSPTTGSDGERGGKVEREPAPFPGWSHPFYWAPFVMLGNWK